MFEIFKEKCRNQLIRWLNVQPQIKSQKDLHTGKYASAVVADKAEKNENNLLYEIKGAAVLQVKTCLQGKITRDAFVEAYKKVYPRSVAVAWDAGDCCHTAWHYATAFAMQEAFVVFFTEDNPRFDADKFREACNLQEFLNDIK